MFGIKVDYQMADVSPFHDLAIKEIVKRKEEQELLVTFLEGKAFDGVNRLEKIQKQAETEVRETANVLNYKDQAEAECLERLKAIKEDGLSEYEAFVLHIVAQTGDLNCKRYIELLRNKKKAEVPRTFPGFHKKAETILMGKLHGDIGEEECRQYLVNRKIKDAISTTAKDMFFAINNGLTGEQVQNFLAIMFEIRAKVTRAITNENRFKKNLLNALADGSTLDLVHVKCLRFAYPEGKRMRILEGIGEQEITTKTGEKYFFNNETEYYQELSSFVKMFRFNGVNANLVIILNDQDLHDHFPQGTEGLVPEEDLSVVFTSLEKYKEEVNRFLGGGVFLLSEYLEFIGMREKFGDFRTETLNQLKCGKGILPEGYVESRVNYRFDFGNKVFATELSRSSARIRVYEELASMQALSVLGEKGDMVMIEKEMGEDSNYIGGHGKTALPVFFTNL